MSYILFKSVMEINYTDFNFENKKLNDLNNVPLPGYHFENLEGFKCDPKRNCWEPELSIKETALCYKHNIICDKCSSVLGTIMLDVKNQKVNISKEHLEDVATREVVEFNNEVIVHFY